MEGRIGEGQDQPREGRQTPLAPARPVQLPERAQPAYSDTSASDAADAYAASTSAMRAI